MRHFFFLENSVIYLLGENPRISSEKKNEVSPDNPSGEAKLKAREYLMRLEESVENTAKKGLIKTLPRPPEFDENPIYLKDKSGNKVKIERKRLKFLKGEIVIFYKKPELLNDHSPIKTDDENQITPIGKIDSRWINSNTAYFNCHTFSLQEAGLSPTDWVQGSKEPTKNTNPVQVILNSYYKKVGTYQTLDYGNVENSKDLQEGDVLMLVKNTQPEGTVFVHSGKIIKVRGKHWIISKIGECPIMVVPISTIVKIYQSSNDRMEIYRFDVQ